MAGQSGSPLINLPGTAPSTLADWQVYLNGLVMGPGTQYLIVNPDFFGTPEVRNTDAARQQEDGDWAGRDTYGSRPMTLQLTIKGSSAVDAQSAHNALMRAWYSDPATPYTNLWWKHPGVAPQRAIGRPRRVAANKSRLLSGRIDIVAEFYSPFAPIYGENVSLTASPRIVTGGGRSYPLLYPRVYTVSVSGGPALADNAGSYPAWAALTFSGTCSTPTLVNDTTGAFIGFDTAIAPGDLLIVDMRLRTAYLNGASVRHLLTPGSTWWNLPSGQSSLRFVPTPHDAAAHCDILFAPASIG